MAACIVSRVLVDPEIKPEIAYGGWMKVEDDGAMSTCASKDLGLLGGPPTPIYGGD